MGRRLTVTSPRAALSAGAGAGDLRQVGEHVALARSELRGLSRTRAGHSRTGHQSREEARARVTLGSQCLRFLFNYAPWTCRGEVSDPRPGRGLNGGQFRFRAAVGTFPETCQFYTFGARRSLLVLPRRPAGGMPN